VRTVPPDDLDPLGQELSAQRIEIIMRRYENHWGRPKCSQSPNTQLGEPA